MRKDPHLIPVRVLLFVALIAADLAGRITQLDKAGTICPCKRA